MVYTTIIQIIIIYCFSIFLGDSTAMENDIDNFIQHDEVKKNVSCIILRYYILFVDYS